MDPLSVDYVDLVRNLDAPPVAADVGAVLLNALAERYEGEYRDCSLLQFVQSGATYLFDLASAAGAVREDRTVAAWTATPATVGKRDVIYQRGFPLPSANASERWSERRPPLLATSTLVTCFTPTTARTLRR